MAVPSSVLDLTKAAAWCGYRFGHVTGDALRSVLAEAVGAARPELAARARTESLDWLRSTFDPLPYPAARPRENQGWLDDLPPASDRTDILQDGEELNDDRARRRLAPASPLAAQHLDTNHRKEPSEMSNVHDPVRRARAQREAERRAGLKDLPSTINQARLEGRNLDAKEGGGSLVDELRALIALAKETDLKVEDLIRHLEDLADLKRTPGSDETLRDMKDVTGANGLVAKARAQVAEKQRLKPLPSEVKFGGARGGSAA